MTLHLHEYIAGLWVNFASSRIVWKYCMYVQTLVKYAGRISILKNSHNTKIESFAKYMCTCKTDKTVIEPNTSIKT